MSVLHRTQIYIGEPEIGQLKIEAEREKTTVSNLIRAAVKRFLEDKAKNLPWRTDSLTKAIGKIHLTVDDASENHDQYLYGAGKRKA